MDINTCEGFEKYLFDRENISSETSFNHARFVDDDLCYTNFCNDTIIFIKNIYSNIQQIAERYTEINIYLGLEYTINSVAGDICRIFSDKKIDGHLRTSAVSAMSNVFVYFFNEKCQNKTSTDFGSCFNSYRCNYLCYMWWDLFPWEGDPYQKHMHDIDQIILEIMRRCLSLNNLACKESALHGLGQ